MRTNTFILDEDFADVSTNNNEKNIQPNSTSDIPTDLLTEISKYIKSEKKEAQPIYRLQHKKVDEIEDIMITLLQVLDSFENLITLAEQFSENETLRNWMKSMEAIYKRLKIILGKNGLQPIESLGIPVDFSIHEVVEYRRTADGITNLVIEEKQKGYKYKGKVIREARVVVANNEGGK